MSERWRRIVRPALAVTVLLVVLIGVDPAAVVHRLAGADLALALPAVLGLTAMHLIPAIAWRAMLARAAGLRLPLRTALALFYAAQAVGGVTPANLGGDIHRAGTLRRWGQDWRASVAPLVIQRATSYVALAVLAAASLWLLAGRTEQATALVAIGLAFAGTVALMAWLLLRPPHVLRAVHGRLLALLAGGEVGTQGAPGLGPNALIGLVSGAVFHAGSIGLTWMLVVSVDASALTPLVPAALAVARLALAVPLTPSGIGVQEGTLALLFSALALSPSSALAGLLLGRLALLLTTILGVVLLARRPAGVPGTVPQHRNSAPTTG